MLTMWWWGSGRPIIICDECVCWWMPAGGVWWSGIRKPGIGWCCASWCCGECGCIIWLSTAATPGGGGGEIPREAPGDGWGRMGGGRLLGIGGPDISVWLSSPPSLHPSTTATSPANNSHVWSIMVWMTLFCKFMTNKISLLWSSWGPSLECTCKWAY